MSVGSATGDGTGSDLASGVIAQRMKKVNIHRDNLLAHSLDTRRYKEVRVSNDTSRNLGFTK